MVRYDRIWELCKETGKKRSYLSKAMGHSERYLLDARKQNTNIKLEELRILAAELNTTLEYLTGETDDPNIKKSPAVSSEGSLDAELIKRLIQLTPEEAAKVDAFVQGILANRST